MLNIGKIWDVIAEKNIEPQEILELVEEVKKKEEHPNLINNYKENLKTRLTNDLSFKTIIGEV